jgi:hypothetical protein
MKMRTIPLVLLAGATLAASVLPALAWWQFVALGPNGERRVSPRFSTEKQCQAALKTAEASLEKKYPNPDRFPLVGSCEQFH